MLKKFYSVLIVISIIASGLAAVNVSAYDDLKTSEQETAAGLVTALNIMPANSITEFGSNTIVSRGQYALYVARLMNYTVSVAEKGAKGSFDDVDISTEQGAAVQMLADLGAISKATREFNPNNGITYNDAVKILMSTLGYDVFASSYGGYPAGYKKVADENGINKGLSSISTTALTKTEVAVILHNALSVYPMENFNNEYKKASKTVLEKYYNVYEVTGIVTGYGKTTLIDMTLGDDQVSIGDTTYECAVPDIKNYVGHKVKAYYTSEKTGGETVISFTEAARQNTVTTVDVDDIDSVTDSAVRYYPEGSKTRKKISLAKEISIIYNDRYLGAGADLAEIIDGVIEGDVTFIANDGSTEASVVVINSYKHLLIERVDKRNYRMYLKNGSGSAKRADDPTYLADTITTDPDDIDLYVYMGDEKVTFDSIEPGDAVTMKESLDGDTVSLYISRNIVTGTVNSVSDNKIKIDRESYDISPYVDKAYTVSTKGTFAITTNGKLLGLVEVSRSENTNYAYVLKAYEDDSPGRACVKLFTSGGEVVEKRCAKSMKINGSKSASTRIVNILKEGELVTYGLNSDDEFSYIDRPYDATSKYISVDNEGSLDLYVNETDFVKDWNKSSVRYVQGIMGMTFITDDTVIFSMPRFDNDDYTEYRLLKASELENRIYSDVTAYDIDRQGRAGAIVIVEDTAASVSMASPLLFISDISYATDDDDAEIVRVKGFEKGEEVTLDFDDGSKSVTYEDGWMNYSGNEDFDQGYESLAIGDAIQYVNGNDGKVSAYRMVYNNKKTAYDAKGRYIENNAEKYYEDWSATGSVTKLDFSDNLYIAYGDVQMRYMDYMVILALPDYDRLRYASGSSPVSIMDYFRPINLLDNAYVYVYDVNAKDANKLEIGDMDDIQKGDVCFVRSKKMGELNEIMVYKN